MWSDAPVEPQAVSAVVPGRRGRRRAGAVHAGRGETRPGRPHDADRIAAERSSDQRNAVAGNYADVHFTLLAPEPINGEVFLSGAFTNWSFANEYKMTYDAIRKEYRGTAFLKQGWYDYQYVVKSSTLPAYYFEGTHFETENEYEILVYYKAFQPNADLLIGYIRVLENPQARSEDNY